MHFALITVLSTAMLGILADGENTQAAKKLTKETTEKAKEKIANIPAYGAPILIEHETARHNTWGNDVALGTPTALTVDSGTSVDSRKAQAPPAKQPEIKPTMDEIEVAAAAMGLTLKQWYDLPKTKQDEILQIIRKT